MVVVLFGPPGSGKGTQSRAIGARLRIPAISTGDMLRSACEDDGAERPAGASCAIMFRGGLVDDDVVNRMLVTRLAERDCSDGFLLDGYPRTIRQADFLDEYLERRRLGRPKIIHLDVDPLKLVERMSSRRHCPGCSRAYHLRFRPPLVEGRCDEDGLELTTRTDDKPDVIVERLHSYERATGPLIQYYLSGDYWRVDGNRRPDEIEREIQTLLSRDTRPAPAAEFQSAESTGRF